MCTVKVGSLCNVSDTRTRNWRPKPILENWYHKHVRKQSMSYSLSDTGIRKIWYQITRETCQKPVTKKRFLALISDKCVMGIRTVLAHVKDVTKMRFQSCLEVYRVQSVLVDVFGEHIKRRGTPCTSVQSNNLHFESRSTSDLVCTSLQGAATSGI